MIRTVTHDLTEALAKAEPVVPRLVAVSAASLAAGETELQVVANLLVEVLADGYSLDVVACIAAEAIVEAAKAKGGLPHGRRYPTRDDRDAIAEEAAAKRRADA